MHPDHDAVFRFTLAATWVDVAQIEAEVAQRKFDDHVRLYGDTRDPDAPNMTVPLPRRVGEMLSRKRPFPSPIWNDAMHGDILNCKMRVEVLRTLSPKVLKRKREVGAMQFNPAIFRIVYEDNLDKLTD